MEPSCEPAEKDFYPSRYAEEKRREKKNHNIMTLLGWHTRLTLLENITHHFQKTDFDSLLLELYLKIEIFGE